MIKNGIVSKKEIERLLNGQTKTILNAVDFKLGRTDKKLEKIELRLGKLEMRLAGLEARMGEVEIGLGKMETELNKKFDRLVTTLDRFLKRMSDLDDEFTMMKADINRLKVIIKEKLGVSV